MYFENVKFSLVFQATNKISVQAEPPFSSFIDGLQKTSRTQPVRKNGVEREKIVNVWKKIEIGLIRFHKYSVSYCINPCQKGGCSSGTNSK